MTNKISKLFERFQSPLGLVPLKQSQQQHFKISSDNISILDLMRPTAIQLVDQTTLDYFQKLPPAIAEHHTNQWLQQQPQLLIFCECAAPESIIKRTGSQTHIWRSKLPAEQVLSQLQDYFKQLQAKPFYKHGVFLEVFGVGVMLTGAPGIGKSELALELISRGHRLIADDSIQLTVISEGVIEGRSKQLIQDFMEVRGLGILNIRKLFGDSAIKIRKNLQLVIQLKAMKLHEVQTLDRLNEYRSCKVEGHEIPSSIIPVTPGKSLAILVETATKQHIQHHQGYDAMSDFIEKQQAAIRRQAKR